MVKKERISESFRKIGQEEIYNEQRNAIARLMSHADEVGPSLETIPSDILIEVEEPLPPFLTLPNETIEKIFEYVSAFKYSISEMEGMKAINSYGRANISLLRTHRLKSVCRRFKEVLDSARSRVLKVPIGLKITGLVDSNPFYLETFALHVYGGPGSATPVRNVAPHEFVKAIHPGRITTNFSVARVVLNDYLMEGILALDLSQVKEVFFYDLLEVSLKDPQASLMKLATNCKNVTKFEFAGMDVKIGEYFSKKVIETLEKDKEGFVVEKALYTASDLKEYSRLHRRCEKGKKIRSYKWMKRNFQRAMIQKRVRKRERDHRYRLSVRASSM